VLSYQSAGFNVDTIPVAAGDNHRGFDGCEARWPLWGISPIQTLLFIWRTRTLHR